MRYGNNVKSKTTRKVYDNAGNEDVHGWYLLKNGWEYWQLGRLTQTVICSDSLWDRSRIRDVQHSRDSAARGERY